MVVFWFLACICSIIWLYCFLFFMAVVDFVMPMFGFTFYVILLSFHFICITFIPIESLFSYGCFLVFGIHLLYNLSTLFSILYGRGWFCYAYVWLPILCDFIVFSFYLHNIHTYVANYTNAIQITNILPVILPLTYLTWF